MPKSPGETWELTEEKVTNFISEKLKIEPVRIERAHRTGQQGNKRARTVLIKLGNYKDRERMLKAAREKRIKDTYINEDFSQKVITKRKSLVPKMMEARAAGKIAFLSFDRLVIKDK